MPAANLLGQTFDRLTVVALHERTPSGTLWQCRCVCGGESIRHTSRLRRAKSIGCKACEPFSRAVAHLTHGGAFQGQSQLYQRWKGMLGRCYNPNSNVWKYYGGKGIRVCREWWEFPSFYEWSKDTYRPGLSLDRINPGKNYSPDNCEWVTRSENSRRAMRHYWRGRRAPSRKK